jgi:hypothetical protein
MFWGGYPTLGDQRDATDTNIVLNLGSVRQWDRDDRQT